MSMHTQFLEGVKVLDLSEGIAGPFCAKLLADLGADTVKVERPDGGDISRTFGPFPDDDPDIEQSASFFYLNTGKRSMVLDITSPENRTTLATLVQRFDVIIGCERLTRSGVGYPEIHAWNSTAVFTSVTGLGDDGPYAGFLYSHLISCALGGWAHLCGVPEREPLQVGGAIAETLCGAYAAAATLLAVLGRTHHGGGDHVEASIQQAVLCGAQIPSLLYEYRNIVLERYSSIGSGAGACYMLPTRDGYIGLNALTLPQWHMLCKFLGREDIALEERYQGITRISPDERIEEVREIFRAALADRTAAELFHEAQAWRVPFGLVPDLAMLFELEPHRERDFFQEIKHPSCGTVKVPGVAFKSNAASTQLTRPPLLGEHTEEILDELRNPGPSVDSGGKDNELNPLPLEGLRVLDLSMFFAGP
ncbi:MAG: CoA transferase, partial [Gammaproteobacteria bacterium]|nr:CoA transferase [Gammaproteobacteria bacterium]